MLLALLACFSTPKETGDTSGDTSADTSGDTSDTGGAPVEPVTVSIPIGGFDMGCDDVGCEADEAPVHHVVVSAFTLDVYEVTVAMYAECQRAGACTEAWGEQGGDDTPIVGVTYSQASAYCAWRGMRVPTEAEWERAARGDDGRAFPWGEATPTCDLAASRACDGSLVAVGRHAAGAGPYGTLDQAGNAWEWVSDAYDAGYYAESPDTDPTGPGSGGLRTVRGMDLWSDPDALRATNRTYAIPTGVSPLVGFRCAGDP